MDEIRDEIDGIDSEMLRLLNRRMELAIEVGRIKASKGLPLFHPEREAIIFQRLSKLNPGPLSEESLRSIYREIFAASRLIQYRLQVAFLGPEWTYSHLASISLFGHSASYLPCASLEEVFDSFLKGKAHLAVIPIENSLQGGVGHSMDLLYEREVHVISECYLEIAHYLCGNVQDLGEIKRLYGHAQAIDQCRRWLLENIAHAEHDRVLFDRPLRRSGKGRTRTGRPFATSMRPSATDSAFWPNGSRTIRETPPGFWRWATTPIRRPGTTRPRCSLRFPTGPGHCSPPLARFPRSI